MEKWKNTGKYAKINKYLDIIGVVLVVALIVITCIYWIKAPDIVPIHFNFRVKLIPMVLKIHYLYYYL